jgi:hypothetical protein
LRKYDLFVPQAVLIHQCDNWFVVLHDLPVL